MSKWVEGEQLAKRLHKNCGIPRKNILPATQARHTTTTFRNSAHILRQLHAPKNKPMLVVTDELQMKHITNEPNSRTEKDQGCNLGRIGLKRDRTTIEYLPSEKVELSDPRNPMDL